MTLAPAATQPTNALAAEKVRWTGSWPALVAWGAGLIQLALGAGALTGDNRTAWMTATGAVLLLLGVLALAWGVLALARGRIVASRAGIAGSLTGVVAVVAAMIADPARVSVIAVGAASALLIVLGVACGIRLRRGEQPSAASRPGIIGMLIGALLVSALVTPALGATEAGRLAPDHSSHDIVFNEHEH